MFSLKFIRFYFSKILFLALISIILIGSFGVQAQESPRIQKSNLFSDKKGLIDGFGPQELSGTESGGGGSEERELFYSVMRKVLVVLKRKAIFDFNDGKKIDVRQLENALRVTIVPTYEQLYDKENVPVDLKNDPDQLLIWFNVPKWNQLTEAKKIHFGLHELLGIMRFPDPSYKYSFQLQQYYLEASKINPPQIELQPQSIDRSVIFELLTSAKSANENIVLSPHCQQFVPQFQGFCLIKSVLENGVMRQLVYLVQGTPEDFRSNSIGMSNVYALKTYVNVPSEYLSFVIAVTKVDNGTIEVFNKEDCVAKSLSAASEVTDGNLCVVASFSNKH